jgi:hypothetical protein
VNNHAIWLWCSNPSPAAFRGAFRIDHIDFNYPKSIGLVAVYGPCYGLIDHNFMTGAGEHAIWTGLILDSETGATAQTSLGSWALGALPFLPGSANNGNYLYIEDNTFVGSDPTQVYSIKDTMYSGGRTVIRHNMVTNAMMYSHWTSHGTISSEWLEVYNNKFTAAAGDIVPYPGRMQGGGTGIMHDNTFVGYGSLNFVIGEGRANGQSQPPLNFCDGTNAWDGNAGDPNAPGWPCLAQTGRAAGVTVANIIAGNKQSSFPMYLWNNGQQDSCYNPNAGGPVCDNSFGVEHSDAKTLPYFSSTPHAVPGPYGVGDVDYSVTASQPAGAGTHTLNYTPYTYPHPLALQP